MEEDVSDTQAERPMLEIGGIHYDYRFRLRVTSQRNKELQNKGRSVDVPLHAWLPL